MHQPCVAPVCCCITTRLLVHVPSECRGGSADGWISARHSLLTREAQTGLCHRARPLHRAGPRHRAGSRFRLSDGCRLIGMLPGIAAPGHRRPLHPAAAAASAAPGHRRRPRQLPSLVESRSLVPGLSQPRRLACSLPARIGARRMGETSAERGWKQQKQLFNQGSSVQLCPQGVEPGALGVVMAQ